MKILITGGTGFIGSALVRECAGNADVVVLTRDVGKARAKFADNVVAIEDLNALPTDSPPDAIINLAGENLSSGRWNEQRKAQFLESRLSVTRQVVDYIERCDVRPKVFISGSAVGYYGDCGSAEVDESRAVGDEYQSMLCEQWEQMALRAEQFGTRVCLIRTGIVLGHGGALKAMLLPFRFGLGGWLGNGRQYMSWIHIQDMVDLIQHLVRHDHLRGPYNATAPNPVTNKLFSKTLGKVLVRPVLFPIPAVILRLLVGEMSDLLLTGQNVLPNRLRESNFRFRFETLESALRDVLDG